MITGVFLIFMSALQFVSGVSFLRRLDQKALWPLNVLVGIVGYFICGYILVMNSAGPYSVFVGSFVLLSATDAFFGAIQATKILDQRVQGYFNLFMAVICALWSLGFRDIGSFTMAVCFMYWAVLYIFVACILVYGRTWFKLAGYMLVVSAYLTTFLPGYLLIMGNKLP